MWREAGQVRRVIHPAGVQGEVLKLEALLLPFFQNPQDIQGFLIIKRPTPAPLIVDPVRRVQRDGPLLPRTPVLDVRCELVQRFASLGDGQQGGVAARRAARGQTASGKVQEPDVALVALVQARGVLDGRKCLIAQEDGFAGTAFRGGYAGNKLVELRIKEEKFFVAPILDLCPFAPGRAVQFVMEGDVDFL